jgi:hypothetical protein
MTLTDITTRLPTTMDLPPEPVLEVCVSLVPGMALEVRLDRCEGQIPLLDIMAGRAHLLVTFDVVYAEDLNEGHAALAEQFATAACGLRDELRRIVAGQPR